MNNSRLDSATDGCVNLAPGCIDHVRNSLWSAGLTLALLGMLSVFWFLAVA
jgi:hypothetical protein